MKKQRNATAKRSKSKPQVKRPVVFSIGDGADHAGKVNGKTTGLYATGRPDQPPHTSDRAVLGCACKGCVRARYLYEHNALIGAAMGALTTRHNERENRKNQRDWERPPSEPAWTQSPVAPLGNGEQPASRPGGDSSPFQRGGSSGGPLDRGDDSRGPFNRR